MLGVTAVGGFRQFLTPSFLLPVVTDPDLGDDLNMMKAYIQCRNKGRPRMRTAICSELTAAGESATITHEKRHSEA